MIACDQQGKSSAQGRHIMIESGIEGPEMTETRCRIVPVVQHKPVTMGRTGECRVKVNRRGIKLREYGILGP